MAYEDFISELEEFPNSAAAEAASDALAFVAALNEALIESGADLPEDPNVDKIGSVLDHIFSEMVAASIFLSGVPGVANTLRGIAEKFEEVDVAFTDPSGETRPSVPDSVVQGYLDFAKRIEGTQKQTAEISETLKKWNDQNKSA